ncbi:hypothetical protein OB2597_02717 [Pseudooceanicola batsensis HTCC2597]|uniref:Uncharacterized protein n=1 Tax=Pseudooceanicola batsensis (strain ATCC BAA-863 / DSM 15984 / KCTC 12145 / HTCC2597) TaxID=252305 RepID=A3TXD7_PSEBH|nr:hypothetical protein [Pseudooceanicola batsensis]EAQ03497.1 hypothetical protein OB2597_02717 [Pseudooceanicola batsensis HTCC2597]
MIAINYVMAALFLAIGAFVTWRMRTVERLLDVSPAGPEAQAVRRVESIASLVMLVFGVTCLTGAVLRVWSEGAAAFG